MLKILLPKLVLTSTGKKTKVLKINTTITEPVWLDGDFLEEVNSFTYLGSVVEIQEAQKLTLKPELAKLEQFFCS